MGPREGPHRGRTGRATAWSSGLVVAASVAEQLGQAFVGPRAYAAEHVERPAARELATRGLELLHLGGHGRIDQVGRPPPSPSATDEEWEQPWSGGRPPGQEEIEEIETRPCILGTRPAAVGAGVRLGHRCAPRRRPAWEGRPGAEGARARTHRTASTAGAWRRADASAGSRWAWLSSRLGPRWAWARVDRRPAPRRRRPAHSGVGRRATSPRRAP